MVTVRRTLGDFERAMGLGFREAQVALEVSGARSVHILRQFRSAQSQGSGLECEFTGKPNQCRLLLVAEMALFPLQVDRHVSSDSIAMLGAHDTVIATMALVVEYRGRCRIARRIVLS